MPCNYYFGDREGDKCESDARKIRQAAIEHHREVEIELEKLRDIVKEYELMVGENNIIETPPHSKTWEEIIEKLDISDFMKKYNGWGK